MKKIVLSLISFLLTAAAFSQNNPILQYKNTGFNKSYLTADTAAIAWITSLKKESENNSSLFETENIDNVKNNFVNHFPYLADTLAKTNEDSISIFIKNVIYGNVIPLDWKQRKNTLYALKRSLNNSSLADTQKINALKSYIKQIKDYTTQECLTTQKKPRTFSLFQAGRYDFDTLNNFFYAQNNVDVFQTAAIQNFTNSSTVLSAELASFLFGPVRMGVGGTFETQQDTSQDNAIKKSLQKILYSGGDVNLNFSVPVVFIHTRGRQVYFSIFAQTYNSINPGIDSTGATDFSKNVLYTNQSGFDFHFELGSNDHLGTVNNNARLYFDFPIYYTWGSKTTYEQLNQPDFSVLKMQFGAVLGNIVNIHVSGPLVSTSKNIQKIPFSVSLQFSPTKAVQSISSK